MSCLDPGTFILHQTKFCKVFLSCANLGFCYLNRTGTTKLKYERKNEVNSGLRAWLHGGGGPQVGEVTR